MWVLSRLRWSKNHCRLMVIYWQLWKRSMQCHGNWILYCTWTWVGINGDVCIGSYTVHERGWGLGMCVFMYIKYIILFIWMRRVWWDLKAYTRKLGSCSDGCDQILSSTTKKQKNLKRAMVYLCMMRREYHILFFCSLVCCNRFV